MKKLALLTLAIMLVVSSVGCNQNGTSTPPVSPTFNQGALSPNSLDPDPFLTFLDNEGFTDKITQASLIDQMEKYSYNGTTVADYAVGCYYDGPNGGGYNAQSDCISFMNDYYDNEETGVKKYTNYLFTKVPLKGLTLPYGITFSDTVTTALAKLGIMNDPRLNFTADSGTVDTMTLAAGGNVKLYYVDLTRTAESIDCADPLRLKFEQVYQTESSTVTRSLTLSYYSGKSSRDGKFFSARISIVKNYNN